MSQQYSGEINYYDAPMTIQSNHIRNPRIFTGTVYALVLAFTTFYTPKFLFQAVGLYTPAVTGHTLVSVLMLATMLAALVRQSFQTLLHTLRPYDIFFILIPLVWTSIELTRESPDFFLILEIFIFYSVFVLTRYYLYYFDLGMLINTFLVFCSVICTLHIILIISLVHLRIPLGFIQTAEIVNRNGISIVILFTLGMHFVARMKFGWPIILLYILTFIEITLNNARTSLLAFILLLAFVFLQQAGRRALLYASFAIMAAIAILLLSIMVAPDALHALLSTAYDLGANDNMRSVSSRLLSNKLAFDSFIDNFLFGSGAANVFDLKALGYMSHTYPMLVLASYGIFGFAPLIVFVVAALYSNARTDYVSANVFLSLFLLSGIFFNDLWSISAVLFAISVHLSSQRIQS